MHYAVDGVQRGPWLRPPVVRQRPPVSARSRTTVDGRAIPAIDGLRLRPPVLATLPTAAATVWDTPSSHHRAFPLIPAVLGTALILLGAAGWTLTRLYHPTLAPALATATPVAATPVTPATPTPVPAVAPPLPDLQKLLDDFAATQPVPFGLVVINLASGQTATHNADLVMESASLYKLFVADAVYHAIDNAKLNYGSPAGGGTGRNIADCLNLMITVSDNGCGWALGAVAGWSRDNAYLHNLGFTHTDLATPQRTSASDVARLLQKLSDGTLLSPNSSEQFLNLLKAQKVNNRLPQGLPAGTVIAHKTGDLDGFMHDAGIIYGPKASYIIVATSGPWSLPGNALSHFANLSAQVWAALE